MYKHIILIILFAIVQTAHAQDVEQLAKADPVSWSGGVTWSNILTWPKDSARQVPGYSYYISGSLNTTVLGVVSVPISFAYTNNKLSSTVTYPFNRFTLTPSWKWVRLHIGYSQMTFSPYTMSGHDFLGGGVELTPAEMPWTAAVFFGRLNKAVGRDSINTEPIYKRMGGGVMGGYKGEKITVTANLSICKDVASSLTFAEGIDTTYIAPQSNLVGGVSAMVRPFDQTTIEGEYAMSIVNMNCKADTLGHTESFFEDNTDISRHTAGKVSISQSFGTGSVGVTYERVSPSYRSFASYYNTNNFENVMANFAIDIVQKVNLNANVGWQRDNLNKQEVNTNSQLIYSVSANASPSERISVGGTVSNVQSYVHIKDILEQVTQTTQYQNLDTLSFTELNFSASANGNYRFGDKERLLQNISSSYTYQKASHEQENSQRFVNNRLHNLNANYQATHTLTKLSGSMGVNYNINKTPEAESNVLTLTASVGIPIVKKVRTNVSVNYSVVDSQTDYRIINARLSLSYSFLKYHSLNCSLTALNNDANGRGTQYTANITYNLSLGYSIKRKSAKRTTEE